ncbi:placenta-specific gene 8 protein-like [Plakobranchus ocellatus]|uniref:Placenta-specific gene 8 protein-like n=1 Tax=Plakobranchus ocellatus TaxID=259542 RepID=A0AAV4CZS9_9GAST|nr:placenta-specific gene 8 protein-like [Plakobranchus ocellatus]
MESEMKETEERVPDSPARITPLDLTITHLPGGLSSTFNPGQQPVINAGYVGDHPGSPEWQTIDIEFDDPPFYQPYYFQRRSTQDFSIHELPSIQSLTSPAQTGQNSTAAEVVVKQPHRVTEPLADGRPWSHGLFDCCGHRQICLYGTFCSPCLACRVSRDLEESAWVPCCVPFWLLVLRTKLRAHQDIGGSVLVDCCEVTWCGPCALCQLAREIEHCQSDGQT